jgi:hypothetical protein
MADLAALLPEAADPSPMSPSVIRPVRSRGATAAALKSEPVTEPARIPAMDRFLEGASRLRVVE